MKKIDISKLEKLAKKNQDRSGEDQQITFEASGQGGFYVYEKTEDSNITTIVSKRNFKTVEVTRNIKNHKNNTSEYYAYSPEGTLKIYSKSKNSYKIEDNDIGEIQISNYVEVLEKYDEDGSVKFRRDYNDFYKITVQDIIRIARDNRYKNVDILKIYLDDNFASIPAFGVTMDDISKEKPYWIVSFTDLNLKTNGTHIISRIYDGVSGEFIKEKEMTIVTGMDHKQ